MPLYSADTIPLHSAIPPYASPFSLIPFFLPPPSFSCPSFSRCRLPSSVTSLSAPPPSPRSPVQWASALCFPPPSLVPVPSIRIMIICRKINIILS